MNMDDLISIIVPIYRVEKYLPKCIDSILAQTYANIEVILVDDGSPDNCGRIADDYAARDSRIHVVHKANGGLSSARNAGVDVVKGAYVGFVNSDDYIHPEMYEKLYKAIKNSDASLSICNYAWLNEDGAMVEKDLLGGKVSTCVLSRDEAFSALHERCGRVYVTAVNKLYKTSILDTIRFPEMKVHEDEFTIHHFFALCDKIACISDVLYYYVQRDGNVTCNYELKNFDSFNALIDRYLFYKKNGYKDLAAKVLGNSAYGLFMTIRKVHNKKMFARWLGLMVRHFFLMLGNLQICFSIVGKFLGKIVRYIKRYFVWMSVKSAFNKTTGMKRRVILVATPEHGNLGDHAIVYAEHQIFKKCGLVKNVVEIPNSIYLKYHKRIQQLVRQQDLIVVDGGGSLGTLWPDEDDKIADIIFRFKGNKIIVFPQTCYYGDNSELRLKRNMDIYATATKLTLSFRDKVSFDFAKANFPVTQCEYMPDIVLAIKDVWNEKMRKGVLLCFRRDLEKVISGQTVNDIKKYLQDQNMLFDETDTVIQGGISTRNRNVALRNKWLEFGSAGLVITDRLHGMIFAAITGTPCIAVDNVSKKVSGVYAWIKNLPYIRVLEKHADIVENIPKMYSEIGFAYAFDYPHFFEKEIKL